MIQILVVYEQGLYRTGLASLLNAEPDMTVIGQTHGAGQAARLDRLQNPDVIIVGATELAAVETILTRHPSARLLVLFDRAMSITDALRMGVKGFVNQEATMERIAAAVRAVAGGVMWLAEPVAEELVVRARNGHHSNGVLELLSPREREILAAIAAGLDNSEIAAALHISVHTAKNHVANIREKLGGVNRVQAAVYATQHGLAPWTASS